MEWKNLTKEDDHLVEMSLFFPNDLLAFVVVIDGIG